MRSLFRLSPAALLLIAFAAPGAVAQPEPINLPEPGNERLFGMEFEFAGQGNRIVNFEEMPWENYQRMMREIVEYYGGNPEDIRRVNFTKETTNLERYPTGERELFRAEWNDSRGRKWMIEPEYVASSGFDGYELVTPPMDNPEEVREILKRLRDSGQVREGLKSGVHLNIDGRRLIDANGNARALTNLIMMHENMEPMLRRMFNPIRGGGHSNRFARSIAVDHEDLLKEINELRPEERTRENLERMFRARTEREMRLHEVDPMDPNSMSKLWKYRSMNLAKVLGVNDLHNGRLGVVEFRMFDLDVTNPDTHRLQADLYRAMVRRAETLAAEGIDVKYEPRARMPAGENPSIYNTPENPEEARLKAREMVENLGLDPAQFEELLGRNIKHRTLATESEFRSMLDALPTGRTLHDGKAFTYGFELEGAGEGFAMISRPKDAEVDARWDSMSDAEKKAYYREKVGSNRRSVPEHFNLDLERFPHFDPNWKVEGTGNWEIRSLPSEDLRELTDQMREVKRLTGTSGKGFHLHMRDNAPNWEVLNARGSEFADYVERSSNWVWLERARRLGTMTSLKSWSNNRFTPEDLNNVANMRSSDRHTVRTTVPSSKEYIDIEIRGFTKYVDDIETLGRMYTDRLASAEFGPWRHTDNVLPNVGYNWGGSDREGRSLDFVENFENYSRTVEGREVSPELRRVLDGLQYGYSAKATGSARTYATNVATPLLPWEAEASIPETLRRDLLFQKEEFLRSLRFTSNKVMDGEYGLELGTASREGLMRHLNLTEAEANALVEYRANGGKLETAEDVARAMARGERAGAVSRLSAYDLSAATADGLATRTGIPAEAAERAIEHRNSHDVLDALERGGIEEARILEMVDRAAGLDLGTAAATAEKIAEVLNLSPEAAARIVEYRDANAIETVEDLRRAGLSEAEANRVMGETAEAAGTEGRTFTRYNDLAEAGVSAETIEALRSNSAVNMAKINSLSAVELAEVAGISVEEATKITNAREGSGTRAGLDLANASKSDLEARGMSAADAERLVRFRDAHKIGREGNYTWADYKPETAANELREAGLLTEAEAENVRRLSGEIQLERATAESLAERFGLEADVANRVVAFRDAHTLDRAGLIEAGLTEAQADRVIEETRELDPKRASIEEMASRTGLDAERLVSLLRTSGADLSTLSEADLRSRLGISAEDARKIVEARTAGNTLNSVEKLVEAGLSQADAERVNTLAKGVDVANATLEELRRAGFSEAEANRITEAREKARTAPELNYDEITRQVRFKTKKWARETGLSEALLRSLLPRANPSDVEVTRETVREGEGFSARRAAAPGELVPSKMPYDTVADAFAAVKEAAEARATARLGLAEAEGSTTSAADRALFEKGLDDIRSMRLEIVETNDILADKVEGKIRVSTGLLNELDARAANLPPGERAGFRLRALGMILAHEAGHMGGLKSERAADMESLRILAASKLGSVGGIPVDMSTAEIRETLAAFDRPTGSSRLTNMWNRMRNLVRYGTTTGRVENLERTARGEADPYARFRRADGTINWRRAAVNRAGVEGLGLLHFGLALFLKELAVVVQTGDRTRIEEFFDGLATTDFYKHYGYFVLGARAAEVTYTAFLQRFVKPTFVNSILKTNLVLAAGIALPMIVEGTFEGKAFITTLTALGLSSAAVKTGVRGVKWVYDLARARRAGTLAGLGLRASKWAKVGGWFYTAAELAVILYFAEDFERMWHGWRDRVHAREALADAGEEFVAATNAEGATAESIREAAEKYHAAWIDYRNFLYKSMEEHDMTYARRMSDAGRRGKLSADERAKTVDRINSFAPLRDSILERYESVEAYAATLTKDRDDEIDADVAEYTRVYSNARDEELREIYEENRRNSPYVSDVGNLTWLLTNGQTGQDPYGERTDWLARRGRDSARESLRDALEGASENRLQAYDDEVAMFNAVIGAMRANGRGDLIAGIEDMRDGAALTKDADNALIHDESGSFVTTITGDRTGIIDAMGEGEGR